MTVALAELSCVSTHMKQYLGKDVRYIAVDDGAPINAFDMPDGRRAFQYRWGAGTVTVPRTTTTTGQILRIGNQAWYTEQALDSGGQTITTEGCLITYFARWSAEAQGWIVTDISYPKRAVC